MPSLFWLRLILFARQRRRTAQRQDQMPREDGFALLDAMVALAVSALVLTVYLQLVGQSTKAIQLSDDRALVAAFARSKLDQLGIVEPLTPGTTKGRFADLYTWTQGVTKVPETDGNEHLSATLMRVALTIDWQRGAKRQNASFVIFKLSSNPAGAYAH